MTAIMNLDWKYGTGFLTNKKISGMYWYKYEWCEHNMNLNLK
jgi:hypothetical protein